MHVAFKVLGSNVRPLRQGCTNGISSWNWYLGQTTINRGSKLFRDYALLFQNCSN